MVSQAQLVLPDPQVLQERQVLPARKVLLDL